jgi:hypothetical protein
MGKVRDCMVWWNSIDPRERALLYILLIIYYDGLVALLALFICFPIVILILAFDFYDLLLLSPIPVSVFIVSMDFFRRVLLQCDRLDYFLVGKPLYHIMILDGVMTGLVHALIVVIAAYLILNFMFGFETYASLLIALMPAILTFALVTLIYFKRPWYMIPLLLPLFAIVYFRTGVTNLFQWYLRKREELLARGVCKLNGGA